MTDGSITQGQEASRLNLSSGGPLRRRRGEAGTKPSAAARLAIIVSVVILLLSQLILGSSPLVVALCGGGIFLSLTPYFLFGWDLYTFLSVYLGIRYLGAALIFKTAYGQSLDSFLNDPVTAYALAALLMATFASVITAARRLDGGGSLFGPLPGLRQQRLAGSIAFAVGLVAALVVGALQTRRSGLTNSGTMFVVASLLVSFSYYGLIVETLDRISKTKGRSIISLRLVVMLGAMLLLALFLNVRGMLVNAATAVGLTAFLSRSLRPRHVIAGVIAAFLSATLISPVILQLRMEKEGLTPLSFVAKSAETVALAIQDPDHFAMIEERTRLSERYSSGLVAYDYFGNRANIENRLSFVALLDAVQNGTRSHDLVGFSTFSDSISRNIPRFLNKDKNTGKFAHGDWLSWQMGMSELGRVYSAVFGLPMEGLASFGVPGLVLFPAVFLLGSLVVVSRVVSLREVTPESIFVFVTLQVLWTEATSDVYLGLLVRDGPILALSLWGLRAMAARRIEPTVNQSHYRAP